MPSFARACDHFRVLGLLVRLQIVADGLGLVHAVCLVHAWLPLCRFLGSVPLVVGGLDDADKADMTVMPCLLRHRRPPGLGLGVQLEIVADGLGFVDFGHGFGSLLGVELNNRIVASPQMVVKWALAMPDLKADNSELWKMLFEEGSHLASTLSQG